MKKYILASMGLGILLFSANVQADICVDKNEIDVKWTSFKTLSKIGVSGHFNNIKLRINTKNNTDVKSLLKDAKVSIELESIDANSDVKTINIKKYFVNNLSSKTIEAKIINIYDKSLEVRIRLNGVTKNIPMSYVLRDNVINAKGVIDGQDFELSKALKILNTNVAGHLNKGWNDISISFIIKTNNRCK